MVVLRKGYVNYCFSFSNYFKSLHDILDSSCYYSRHLSIRAGKHLNVSRSSKSATKEHIKKCSSCKTQPNNMKQFEIIRKCQTS